GARPGGIPAGGAAPPPLPDRRLQLPTVALLRKRLRRTPRPPHVPPRPPGVVSRPNSSDAEGAQRAPADNAGLARNSQSMGRRRRQTPPALEPPRPGYAVPGSSYPTSPPRMRP